MKINFLRKIKPKKKNLKHLPFLCLLGTSLETLVGGVLGYFLSEFYVKKANKKQKKFLPSSLFLPLPFLKWKFKFHHWLYGFSALLINLKFSLIHSPFLLAVFVGMSWHDLVRDKEWYLFLYRK